MEMADNSLSTAYVLFGGSRRSNHIFALAGLSLALLLLSGFIFPATAQCIASFRELKFPDGSARVKNYVCKSDGSAKPNIRVEFNRLSEAAAGSLIQGVRSADLEKAFGKFRVIDNTVAVETKKLFDEFGTKSLAFNCYEFRVAAAAGGKGYQSDADRNCGERTMWYLSFPDRENITSLDFPLPADVGHYHAHNDWPKGFSFAYGGGEYCEIDKSPISCTLIWRAARREDLANFEANHAAYNKALGLDAEAPEPSDAAESSEAETPASTAQRYFSLVNYLTRDGFPDDFLFITGSHQGCGGIEFSIHIRQMILDVAFIQNISDDDLSIEGLLASEIEKTDLRSGALRAGKAADRVVPAFSKIEPGETIAVPLAITFVMADSLKELLGNPAEASKTFEKIEGAKAGAVFELKDESEAETVLVKKARESFGPPTIPKHAPYIYGPELVLSGLVIRGKPLIFDQASRNFMQLTAGEGYGSCPYLYAWDEGHKAWIRYGKVIDAANNKEMTEKKTFAGFRSKFRLAEEELEVSYIDHVKLELQLHDGTVTSLSPNFAAISAQDGRYATIKAGDRIDFSFALPPIVKPEDVKQSILEITGYYRRYSDLMARK